MTHTMDLIYDLAVVLAVAGAVTVLFHRLGQPVVLGYIVAGVVIGPHTPPFQLVNDYQTIETLAGLGMIFLMFSLGLEFRLHRLRSVGATALVAAALEIALMIGLGVEIGEALGWSNIDSLFLGAMMSISSTTIVLRALNELGLARERFAEVVFGILIVEDVLAVALLALLSSIAMTGTLAVGDALATLARLGVFLATLLVVGLLVVPPLLAFVARTRSNEMFLVSALGLCFGVSLLASELGYSVALGAFLIGAIMAESEERHRIERLVEPLRDLFSAVFFVAIGLMIDPAMLLAWWRPIGVIVVAVVIGKVFTCSLGAFISGNPPRDSLKVGTALAQIGEFSFIIASLGTSLAVTSDFLYPIAVAVSVITTFLTPYLLRSADPLASLLARAAPSSLTTSLRYYGGFAPRIAAERSDSAASGLTRRLAGRLASRIALNLVLASAVFAVTAAIAARATEVFPGFPAWIDTSQEMAQLASLVLTLPLLVITLATLRRECALLARMGVRRRHPNRGVRVAASRVLFGAASFAMILGVVGISVPALPDLESLGLWLALLAAAGILLWRPSLRGYESARKRLRRTLSAGDEATRE